jgi:hypothetical protein
MIAQRNPIRTRARAALALATVALLGVSACDDDGDSEPDTTLVDELESDPNVPFDPNVPPGVPETDERGNLGFDTEEGGPAGDPTGPRD